MAAEAAWILDLSPAAGGEIVAEGPPSSCGVPLSNFETFDAFELCGVAGDEGGFEAAGLRRDHEVQRADGFASGFEVGADLRVMESGVNVESRDGKQVKKCLELGGLLWVGGHVFLYAGP